MLQLIGLYFIIGVITAGALIMLGNRGLGAFDPHALRDAEGKATIGFRILIFPGMVALWPLLLRRRMQSDASRRESREAPPHIDRRHRLSFILLLVFLPPLFVLALLQGRTAGPPLDTLAGIEAQTQQQTTGSGVPLARATVATDLENAFVPRLELDLLIVREAATGGRLWLHTRSALELLPPDTLLYWTPHTNSADSASDASEISEAYLLGALPPGSGRLELPENATAGRILGYSLAHQKILFRAEPRAVTDP